jgi:hypothetical protein
MPGNVVRARGVLGGQDRAMMVMCCAPRFPLGSMRRGLFILLLLCCAFMLSRVCVHAVSRAVASVLRVHAVSHTSYSSCFCVARSCCLA